ncbi:hypothetical protein ACVBR5_000863 [Burkholderia cenocepacia]
MQTKSFRIISGPLKPVSYLLATGGIGLGFENNGHVLIETGGCFAPIEVEKFLQDDGAAFAEARVHGLKAARAKFNA